MITVCYQLSVWTCAVVTGNVSFNLNTLTASFGTQTRSFTTVQYDTAANRVNLFPNLLLKDGFE